MPIKRKPEPVTMVPGKDYVHMRLQLDDVAEWVEAARAAGVPGSQAVKAQITWGGHLKMISGTPEATDG